MTVKATFPNKKPKLYVDFTSGKPDIRFGSFRETVGSYVGKDGFIKIGNYKTPRIDHDPLTGECLGLLIENGTTNQVTDHREWSSNYKQSVVSGYTITGPDGESGSAREYTVNSDIGTDGGSTGIYNANYGIGASSPISISCYVKVTRDDQISFQWLDNNNNQRSDRIQVFKDGRPAINRASEGGNKAGTVGTSRFQRLPNGWVRLMWENVTGIINSTSYIQLYAYDHILNPNGSNVGYAVYGIQIETGTYCSSVCYSGDTRYDSTASEFNQRGVEQKIQIIDPPFTFPATILAEYRWKDMTYARRPFAIRPEGGSDTIRPLTYTNGTLNFFSSHGTVNLGSGTITRLQDLKFAYVMGVSGKQTENNVTLNSFRAVAGGGSQVTTSSSLTEEHVEKVLLGYSTTGDAPRDFCGHIKRFHVYNGGMTEGQMQALTRF
tara:strand:- start:45 stop:1352 length:1308 start_codon:yes stop_codon:yes gene_type:complete